MIAGMRGWIPGAVLLAACGGSQVQVQVPDEVRIVPEIFLTEIGTEAAPGVFAYPTRSLDELDAARRDARGPDRRRAMRDLAVALIYATIESEGRESRRFRQRAERMIDAAARGNRDDQLRAELDFMRLWLAYRTGSNARAARLAERFGTRHRAAGVLTTMAYMVGGEAAFAEEDYDDAIASYRFALGQLGSPLYAFALYRTAHAHGADGDREEGMNALREVERLGCEHDAAAPVVRLANAAASERETGLRRDPDDVVRPASCPAHDALEAEAEAEQEEGWRPAE